MASRTSSHSNFFLGNLVCISGYGIYLISFLPNTQRARLWRSYLPRSGSKGKRYFLVRTCYELNPRGYEGKSLKMIFSLAPPNLLGKCIFILLSGMCMDVSGAHYIRFRKGTFLREIRRQVFVVFPFVECSNYFQDFSFTKSRSFAHRTYQF